MKKKYSNMTIRKLEEEEVKILSKAKKMAKTTKDALSTSLFHAEQAGRMIGDGIICRKVEIGKRKARKCAAFRKEMITEWGNDTKRKAFGCHGRERRPFSFLEESLFHRYCSNCKLPYSELRTKMMMLEISNKKNRKWIH